MKNPPDDLCFVLESLADFESEKMATRVVDCLTRSVPEECRPLLFGDFDPLKGKVSLDNRAEILGVWLRGAKPATSLGIERQGMVGFKRGSTISYHVFWFKTELKPMFNSLGGSFDYKLIQRDEKMLSRMIEVVKLLVPIVQPVYGEIRNEALPGGNPFDLKVRLPPVPWVSVYGPPYVELFGKQRLLSAPFREVVELCPGYVWARATDDPAKSVPERIQLAIRQHLGEDSFMRGTRSIPKTGIAPVFDFSNVMRAPGVRRSN